MQVFAITIITMINIIVITEYAGLGHQQLAVSLRNSLQCTVWRFVHSLPSKS